MPIILAEPFDPNDPPAGAFLTYNFNNSAEGWIPTGVHTTLTPQPTTLLYTATTATFDPGMRRNPVTPNIPGTTYQTIRFRARTTDGSNPQLVIFFSTTAGGTFGGNYKVMTLNNDDVFHVYDADMSVLSMGLWVGRTIDGLRMDFGTGSAGHSWEIDWIAFIE